MMPFELDAQRKARTLAEQAAANATAGGDPAALDATLGRQQLDVPRVAREPTPNQLAERQFAKTPMNEFMSQRTEEGGIQSPTEWAGLQKNAGQLASGRGSGMAPGVLQKFIDARKRMEPRPPDPSVVAQARSKYADEARQLGNAASGAYGGMAGDMMAGGGGGGGGGGGAGGVYSTVPRGGMRPMNAREMIAYDNQRNDSALGLIRAGIAREQMGRQAKADESRYGLEARQLDRQTTRDVADDAFRKSQMEARQRQEEAELRARERHDAMMAQLIRDRDLERGRHNKETEKPEPPPQPRLTPNVAERQKMLDDLNRKKSRLAGMDKVIEDGGYTDPKTNRWRAITPSKAQRDELARQIQEADSMLNPQGAPQP